MTYPPPTARIGGTFYAPENVFEPQVIMPSQTITDSASWSGERRLMLAVLEDAIATLVRNLGLIGELAAREIETVDRWIASDDSSWTFAFVNVCAACGLEPEYLRRGLRQAREKRQPINRWAWKRGTEKQARMKAPRRRRVA